MQNPIRVLIFDTGNALRARMQTLFEQADCDITMQWVDHTLELDLALNQHDVDCLLLPAPTPDVMAIWLSVLYRIKRHFSAIPLILLGPPDFAGQLAPLAQQYCIGDYVALESTEHVSQTIHTVVNSHRHMRAKYDEGDQEYRQIFRALLGSYDGLCITDAQGSILLVNDGFCMMTGYSQDEVRGKNPRILKSGIHDAEFYVRIWQALTTEHYWQGEICNQHKDGSTYREWLRISAVHDPQGKISHYIGQFSYLAEQKRLVERIHQLGRFDPLTGQPNRLLLLDRLDQSLACARRDGHSLAVVLINLDRFRSVNDAQGLNAGDIILYEVAQRFVQQIRHGDTVARISGNEFGILLDHLTSIEDGQRLVLRLQSCLAEPVSYGAGSVTLTASIGASLYPSDGSDSEALLKSADLALIQSRREGGSTYSFHAANMTDGAHRREAIEHHLRHALDKQELHLVYQPQNSLDSGAITGAEALLRWNSPELGMIGPAEFIPIAEETGLIIPIGAWVLQEACRQNKEWLDLGLARMRLAVNLSAKQFRNKSLVDDIAAILKQTGLPPECLELEITESSLLNDLDSAIGICRQIKSQGIKLSLDDFGTGYSSLTYVSRLPFDKLKIDQSFVRDITQNPANAAIAVATIAIARSLNQSVLAEGVETTAQALFLRSRHCDAMQGYLFSKPLPPAEFAQLLNHSVRLQLNMQTPSERQTLLVVDDERAILSTMRRLFRHETFEIVTADSCAEAFALLAEHPAQVIMSDQRMPEMTGTEFFRRIRQLYPDSIRIILSGYTELASVLDAINEGSVYKFLTKPWDDDQLREQIREAFRAHASKGQS